MYIKEYHNNIDCEWLWKVTDDGLVPIQGFETDDYVIWTWDEIQFHYNEGVGGSHKFDVLTCEEAFIDLLG